MGLNISLKKMKPCCIYETNITHNLAPMWRKAGIYDCLYNSEGKKADTIVVELREGLSKMITSPEEYKKLKPANGWGDYDSAISFLTRLIIEIENEKSAYIDSSS